MRNRIKIKKKKMKSAHLEKMPVVSTHRTPEEMKKKLLSDVLSLIKSPIATFTECVHEKIQEINPNPRCLLSDAVS